LGFVLKVGLVLQLSIMGMEVGSRFRFSVSSMNPDANELGSIYYDYDS